MLVLERKDQEGFWIDDRIFVKVLGIGRRRVKIGIEAPAEARIRRDELPSQPSVSATVTNNSTKGDVP
jgi:carbon storage regulator CsrA